MPTAARPKDVAQGTILLIQVDSLLLRQTDVAAEARAPIECGAVRATETREAGHDPEGSPVG